MRLPAVRHDVFVATYLRVHADNGTLVDLAALVDRSVCTVRCRVSAIRRAGTPLPKLRPVISAPTQLLLGVMLEHVPARGTKPPREIFRDVLADYGSLSTRQLWRALARLRDAGAVQRFGEAGTTDVSYARAA